MRGVKLELAGAASIPTRDLDLKGIATLVATSATDKKSFELPFVVQGPWDDPLMLPDAQILIQRSGAAAPLLDALRGRNERDAAQPATAPAAAARGNAATGSARNRSRRSCRGAGQRGSAVAIRSGPQPGSGRATGAFRQQPRGRPARHRSRRRAGTRARGSCARTRRKAGRIGDERPALRRIALFFTCRAIWRRTGCHFAGLRCFSLVAQSCGEPGATSPDCAL